MKLTDSLERLRSETKQVDEELERFTHEVGFASKLMEVFPERRPEWEPATLKAVAHVIAAVAANHEAESKTDGCTKGTNHATKNGTNAGAKSGMAIGRETGGPGVSAAVREAEEMMSSVAAAAKEFTIHYVGHAHIDMDWLWTWPETVDVCYNTFYTMDRLMDEFPDFRFSQSQTSVYGAMEKYAPEIFAMIKRRVAGGHWEITANTWVEGDKNLASGEALVRQILYTKLFFREKFDIPFDRVKLDWEPDTFGHAWTYPQVLAKAGIDWYYFCRGGREHQLFLWQGPDGSRVLAWNDEKLWYLGPVKPEHVPVALNHFQKTGMKDYLITYGVGDHGGGPTRKDLQQIRSMQDWPVFPKVKFSTLAEFFGAAEAFRDRLPIVDGELNFVFPGCYTSQSNIKHANRVSENLLPAAEALSLVAGHLVGFPYPKETLYSAWINTLFNQFHDILPGSGIHGTYEYSQGLFQEAQAAGTSVMIRALRDIAEAVDTSGAPQDAVPVVVYNPLPWPRTDWVSCDVYDSLAGTNQLRLTNAEGAALPVQHKEEPFWAYRRTRAVFVAEDVPGLGYRTYYLTPSGAEEAVPGGGVEVSRSRGAYGPEDTLENEFLRVTLEPGSGAIISLTDKRSGKEIVPAGERFGLLQLLREAPHGMTAWEIGQVVETVDLHSGAALETVERGPARATIRTRRDHGDSEFILDVTLARGLPRIDFRLDANWLERGGPDAGVPMLKIAFPVDVRDAKARFEIPFGSIERAANGDEVPAQKWVDLSGLDEDGGALGLTLLNADKYGYDMDGGRIRMTLLRGSYDPDPLPEMGRHEILFSVCPHSDGWAPSTATREGLEVNNPFIPTVTSVHGGKLATTAGYLDVEPANAVVAAFKVSESDDGVILRVYETDGVDSEVSARLGFSPNGAVDLDLLEEPVHRTSSLAGERTGDAAGRLGGATDNAVVLTEGCLRFRLRPHEIKTLRILG